MHDPAAGGIANVVLRFQTVDRNGTEYGVNNSPEGLGGITVIPVFTGKTVTQFGRAVFVGIPDKTDGADYPPGITQRNNPGRGPACP